jgi:hypothetical protein
MQAMNWKLRHADGRNPLLLVACATAAGAMFALTGACATAGATLNSGVGDRLMEEAPYYAGRWGVVRDARVAHLPITYQRGAAQEAIFDPEGGPGTPVAELLREMNAYLDSIGVSTRLAGEIPGRGTPDVQFGCEQTPQGECASESRDIAVSGKPWMRLAVARPSERWIAATRSAMDDAGAEYALVITLEVGQYWAHQRNLRGDKEVRLGTDHSARVPWLTSLDQPVQVLQLTGALVGRDGRAVRIGAEGLLARPTPLLASAVGAQGLIGDEHVRRLRTTRRTELAGTPLVWQVALEHLVAELMAR